MGWSSGRHLEKISAVAGILPLVTVLTPASALAWLVESFTPWFALEGHVNVLELEPQYETNEQLGVD